MIWMKFVLMIVAVFIVMFTAKALMRQIFNIERINEDAFARYVDEKHRLIDKRIREYTMVFLFIALIITVVYVEESVYWFMLIVVMTTSLRMSVRAFFEWKYSKYPKQAILTLTEIGVLFIAVVVIWRFNLLV